MTKKQTFLNIFLVLFWIYILYLSWIKWFLEFILAIFIYSIIFYIIYYLWKKIRKKDISNYIKYLPYFFEKIGGSLFLLILILWWFSFYQNEISPAKMPVYHLTNWEKSIIFQWMSHIWTEDFYDNVIANIVKAKKNDYVLFFEWVKPWTEENHNKFDKAIWIKFEKDLYENFSKLYWLSNQRNEDFLLLVNNLDFNIDLSIDEIIKYYEKKVKKNNIKKKESTIISEDENKEAVDITSEVIKILSELNDKELKVLIYVNRWILNFIIKNDTFRTFVTDNVWNTKLFDVILNKRNEILSDAIIKSKYNNIIITYWLMHFNWVFNLLKENDSNWIIEKVEYLYPIK